MDEIKNNGTGAPVQEGQGGGRRRRRKKKHSGGQGNNPNPQNVQQAQSGQQNKPQQGKQQPQQQGKQQAQPQQAQQNQPKNKKQKNKNKQQQPQAQENRKDTYLYALDGNLYVNLTNKCSNGCDFCVRNERSSYYGHYLWLKNEVTVDKVIAVAKGFDLSKYKEAVFCGFGEPTYKVTEMLALCDFFHEKGLSTRLNTNGQGNLINKKDITPEFKGKLDMVNVSLNASCAEKYQPVCRSQFGESAFAAIVEFAKLCKRNGVPCRFSIVDCIGEDEVEACKRLADSVKIPLYIRKYITDSGEND